MKALAHCRGQGGPSGEGKPAIEVVHDSVRDAERSTLTESVYEQIKLDIFDFRMAPGQRYSEQELANRFGVSRTPLRFALHVLAREGYLDRVGGHAGWLVKPFDLSYYEDLYDFRIHIERIAVGRLCTMARAPDLSRAMAFWCQPESKRELDGKIVAQEDEKLHGMLIELAGNREMSRTHRYLTERIRIIRRLDFIDSTRITAAFDEHRSILSAIKARDRDLAEELVSAHIGTSRAEIRHITLHRLAMLAGQRDSAETPSNPTR